jgi:hypothetical protein
MIQTTKQIGKILHQIYDRDYYTVLCDFFELSAIAIRNAVDYSPIRQEYEERYLQTAKKYTKEQLLCISQALGVLITEISNAVDGKGGFYDWAGEIYMDSETYNKNVGQFFTPYHISQVMAKVALDATDIKRRIAEDADTVITINEPTCGAGGLIVAAIETLHRMGVNYAWNTFVDCTDIDPRCVQMTYLTLSLLGVPAVVRLGDSLMMEYRETWFTPAYIFAFPHFNKRLSRGSYPRSPTVPKVEDKPIIAPPPQKVVEPKADKTGQYVINFF